MFGLWILLLLTSLKAEVLAAGGADSITDDQIKDYLINYLDNCKFVSIIYGACRVGGGIT